MTTPWQPPDRLGGRSHGRAPGPCTLALLSPACAAALLLFVACGIDGSDALGAVLREPGPEPVMLAGEVAAVDSTGSHFLLRRGAKLDTVWVARDCVLAGDTRILAIVGLRPGMLVMVMASPLAARCHRAQRISILGAFGPDPDRQLSTAMAVGPD